MSSQGKERPGSPWFNFHRAMGGTYRMRLSLGAGEVLTGGNQVTELEERKIPTQRS